MRLCYGNGWVFLLIKKKLKNKKNNNQKKIQKKRKMLPEQKSRCSSLYWAAVRARILSALTTSLPQGAFYFSSSTQRSLSGPSLCSNQPRSPGHALCDTWLFKSSFFFLLSRSIKVKLMFLLSCSISSVCPKQLLTNFERPTCNHWRVNSF